ncbi:alpha/beta fold hydrolase [Pseudonocardia bannensis]|uniref:Alpha/beta hydrolase n=1 Tax=Pseudonocardia bannensis TaxID=630973 RepID=A0A848DEM0_9PSEU|nr:alpha/beta hydrolase [Pseudonocardia bannensis]NMH91070.1 alpha/beta hydrolase [Pseudonocardia bannensis]
MPMVRTGDVDMHYEESGSGDPIVWIPGTGLAGSMWHTHQVAHFQDRYRCLTLDLRGSGRTVGGHLPPTVADLAADVIGLMDALDLPPAHVVGLSLGSAVAQEIALLRPDRVRSVVLAATWSSTEREKHMQRHFASRLYALENGPVDVYAQFAFWMSSPSVIDEEPDLQAAVEAELRRHMSTRLDGTAAHFRADLVHETAERLPQITCPTLVVYGEEDRITLPRYNERVAAAIPGAAVARIPRAGHLVWLERPAELNGHIDEFLQTAGVASRMSA